jgi:hypothetical protein
MLASLPSISVQPLLASRANAGALVLIVLALLTVLVLLARGSGCS